MSKDWTDGKRWAMGIVGALIVAATVALAGHLIRKHGNKENGKHLLRELELTTPDRDGIRCNGRSPCSPDGEWFGAITTFKLTAAPGQVLVEPHFKCLYGAGASESFWKNLGIKTLDDGRVVVQKVLTWAGPTTFRLTARQVKQPD